MPMYVGVPYLHRPEDLGGLLPDQPSYRSEQLRSWLYSTPVLDLRDMTNLPANLRDRLDPLWPFEVERQQTADDGTTRKWLFRAPDGAAYEAVLMGYSKRVTVCISSQAGCALGCTFCATGQLGFERHLEPGEIVAQVMYAQAFLRQGGMPGVPSHLTNVVLMGMGEPLANLDRVKEALRRLIEVAGMSQRSITVSTVGIVPGIRRLADQGWSVNLALSLHAADDELRSRLVPINRRYPISELEAAAIDYRERTGRRVSIEWTMMDGVNDSDEQALLLAGIAGRMRAHVNLIALNPTPMSQDLPSTEPRIRQFARLLTVRGVTVTVRDTRGKDIDAACGQLRAERAPAAVAIRRRSRNEALLPQPSR